MCKSGRKICFAAVSFLDRFCPILFDACFELLTWILLIQLSLLIGIQHYTISGHSHEFLSSDYKQQVMHLSITTNVTPRKRSGRNSVLKFFHRDWRRCTMSYPSMVKTISLGMWRTSPLNKHTLGLHTSNLCFSFESLYRINLERPLVCFALIFILWDRHTIFYIWERY